MWRWFSQVQEEEDGETKMVARGPQGFGVVFKGAVLDRVEKGGMGEERGLEKFVGRKVIKVGGEPTTPKRLLDALASVAVGGETELTFAKEKGSSSRPGSPRGHKPTPLDLLETPTAKRDIDGEDDDDDDDDAKTIDAVNDAATSSDPGEEASPSSTVHVTKTKSMCGMKFNGLIFQGFVDTETAKDPALQECKLYIGMKVAKIDDVEVHTQRDIAGLMKPIETGQSLTITFEDMSMYTPPSAVYATAASFESDSNSDSEPREASMSMTSARELAFQQLLSADPLDLGMDREQGLRALMWNGAPSRIRAHCWKLLTGCVKPDAVGRPLDLKRKREEYANLLATYWDDEKKHDVVLRKQIEIDVVRMQPGVALFRADVVQKSCIRVLYLWGRRHPASGYVQGMDALLSVFVSVFWSEFFGTNLLSLKTPECVTNAVGTAHPTALLALECDSYHALSTLLSHLHNFYTPAQPGVQEVAFKVKELISKVDPALHDHMIGLGADFLRDFVWRWATCLLVRELPLLVVQRLWDTFLAEGPNCGDFHVYICVTFLRHFRDRILECDFSELMTFLRSLPTESFTLEMMDVLLSEAYVHQKTFEYAT